MLGALPPTEVALSTLVRKHYSFQQGCFVSEHTKTVGGILAFSQVTPVPMWNHAAWIGGTGADFQDFLRRSISWQKDRKRRPVIYLSEPTPGQESALRHLGFEKFDEEAWMVCALSNTSHESALNVREVTNEKSLQEFIGTFSSAFQIKEDGYRTVLQSARDSEVQSRHFVLYDESGAPASVGTLMFAGSIGCIYNVGTPSHKRNKGCGRRIFEHISAAARDAGCEALFLQVENHSAAMRLYEKCGFRTEFLRIGYRVADWKTPSLDRTKLANLLGYRCPETTIPQFLRETRALPPAILAQFRSITLPSNRTVCASALAILLHRYTGEETVAFTLSDPSRAGAESVSLKVERSHTISQWLESILIQTPSPGSAAGEVFLSLHGGQGTNHFEQHAYPLEIHLLPATGTLEFIYRSDLFAKDSVRRLAAHFVIILDYIISSPSAKISDVEMLSAEEKHRLLVEWNQPAFEPIQETIAHLFEMRVERTPDATALMFADVAPSPDTEQLTYRQLNRKANRLAHRLQELGVRSDVFVGVCMDRSPDMIVSLLAILKAGGACVPLDPSYPPERLRFMLQDANAPVILTQKHLLPSIEGASHAKLIFIDEPLRDSKAANERNPILRATPESAAYMIYTSGSTGTPKGVVISNYAIANHCIDCARVYGLSSHDRVLQFSSFNFDAAFEQILPALTSGACLVVRGNEVWNTQQFGDKLGALQLTVVDLPTAYWHQLASEWSSNPETVPSNSLRLAIVGGEALSADKLTLWNSTPLRNVRLINAYGPTETTITATSYEFNAFRDVSTASKVPIGRPRADRKAYVLDCFGNPTPIAVPGELHIGGTLLARGYHKRPELNITRFVPNPFSDEPDARLYRTGDLVRLLDDGNLEFLGRIDDQVKIRGFRIELGEIEACLCKHPAVREAIVLARPDNNNELRLVAYLLSNTSQVALKDIKTFIRHRLPEYMVPARYVFLNEWPLMPNGKVDRRALPEPPEDSGDKPVKGPEDPLELQLQLLFERVLKRAPIAVDVSFFELGGDSLQALELLVEIGKATRKQLPLGTLYQSSTVQTLAREVRTRSSGEEWSSLVPLQASGKRPPLYLLHTTPGDVLGYGNLVYHLDSDQPCYGLQSLGLKAPDLCHHTVQEMARFYVDHLREFQPHGPYYLGGWCYGGIVAVEMARILKTEGEHIGLLALLETVAIPARLNNFRYYLHRLACFLQMSPQNWFTYFRGKARYARESRLANKLRFRPAEAGLHEAERDKRLIQLEHVYNTNLEALKEFRSEYYDGKVTLFNAAERDLALIPDRHYGWIGLAGDIEIHEVPGDHDTMLAEPHVSALAQRLNDCLIRAQHSQTGPKA